MFYLLTVVHMCVLKEFHSQRNLKDDPPLFDSVTDSMRLSFLFTSLFVFLL